MATHRSSAASTEGAQQLAMSTQGAAKERGQLLQRQSTVTNGGDETPRFRDHHSTPNTATSPLLPPPTTEPDRRPCDADRGEQRGDGLGAEAPAKPPTCTTATSESAPTRVAPTPSVTSSSAHLYSSDWSGGGGGDASVSAPPPPRPSPSHFSCATVGLCAPAASAPFFFGTPNHHRDHLHHHHGHNHSSYIAPHPSPLPSTPTPTPTPAHLLPPPHPFGAPLPHHFGAEEEASLGEPQHQHQHNNPDPFLTKTLDTTAPTHTTAATPPHCYELTNHHHHYHHHQYYTPDGDGGGDLASAGSLSPLQQRSQVAPPASTSATPITTLQAKPSSHAAADNNAITKTANTCSHLEGLVAGNAATVETAMMEGAIGIGCECDDANKNDDYDPAPKPTIITSTTTTLPASELSEGLPTAYVPLAKPTAPNLAIEKDIAASVVTEGGERTSTEPRPHRSPSPSQPSRSLQLPPSTPPSAATHKQCNIKQQLSQAAVYEGVGGSTRSCVPLATITASPLLPPAPAPVSPHPTSHQHLHHNTCNGGFSATPSTPSAEEEIYVSSPAEDMGSPQSVVGQAAPNNTASHDGAGGYEEESSGIGGICMPIGDEEERSAALLSAFSTASSGADETNTNTNTTNNASSGAVSLVGGHAARRERMNESRGSEQGGGGGRAFASANGSSVAASSAAVLPTYTYVAAPTPAAAAQSSFGGSHAAAPTALTSFSSLTAATPSAATTTAAATTIGCGNETPSAPSSAQLAPRSGGTSGSGPLQLLGAVHALGGSSSSSAGGQARGGSGSAPLALSPVSLSSAAVAAPAPFCRALPAVGPSLSLSPVTSPPLFSGDLHSFPTPSAHNAPVGALQPKPTQYNADPSFPAPSGEEAQQSPIPLLLASVTCAEAPQAAATTTAMCGEETAAMPQPPQPTKEKASLPLNLDEWGPLQSFSTTSLSQLHQPHNGALGSSASDGFVADFSRPITPQAADCGPRPFFSTAAPAATVAVSNSAATVNCEQPNSSQLVTVGPLITTATMLSADANVCPSTPNPQTVAAASVGIRRRQKTGDAYTHYRLAPPQQRAIPPSAHATPPEGTAAREEDSASVAPPLPHTPPYGFLCTCAEEEPHDVDITNAAAVLFGESGGGGLTLALPTPTPPPPRGRPPRSYANSGSAHPAGRSSSTSAAMTAAPFSPVGSGFSPDLSYASASTAIPGMLPSLPPFHQPQQQQQRKGPHATAAAADTRRPHSASAARPSLPLWPAANGIATSNGTCRRTQSDGCRNALPSSPPPRSCVRADGPRATSAPTWHVVTPSPHQPHRAHTQSFGSEGSMLCDDNAAAGADEKEEGSSPLGGLSLLRRSGRPSSFVLPRRNPPPRPPPAGSFDTAAARSFQYSPLPSSIADSTADAPAAEKHRTPDDEEGRPRVSLEAINAPAVGGIEGDTRQPQMPPSPLFADLGRGFCTATPDGAEMECPTQLIAARFASRNSLSDAPDGDPLTSAAALAPPIPTRVHQQQPQYLRCQRCGGQRLFASFAGKLAGPDGSPLATTDSASNNTTAAMHDEGIVVRCLRPSSATTAPHCGSPLYGGGSANASVNHLAASCGRLQRLLPPLLPRHRANASTNNSSSIPFHNNNTANNNNNNSSCREPPCMAPAAATGRPFHPKEEEEGGEGEGTALDASESHGSLRDLLADFGSDGEPIEEHHHHHHHHSNFENGVFDTDKGPTLHLQPPPSSQSDGLHVQPTAVAESEEGGVDESVQAAAAVGPLPSHTHSNSAHGRNESSLAEKQRAFHGGAASTTCLPTHHSLAFLSGGAPLHRRHSSMPFPSATAAPMPPYPYASSFVTAQQRERPHRSTAVGAVLRPPPDTNTRPLGESADGFVEGFTFTPPPPPQRAGPLGMSLSNTSGSNGQSLFLGLLRGNGTAASGDGVSTLSGLRGVSASGVAATIVGSGSASDSSRPLAAAAQLHLLSSLFSSAGGTSSEGGHHQSAAAEPFSPSALPLLAPSGDDCAFGPPPPVLSPQPPTAAAGGPPICFDALFATITSRRLGASASASANANSGSGGGGTVTGSSSVRAASSMAAPSINANNALAMGGAVATTPDATTTVALMAVATATAAGVVSPLRSTSAPLIEVFAPDDSDASSIEVRGAAEDGHERSVPHTRGRSHTAHGIGNGADNNGADAVTAEDNLPSAAGSRTQMRNSHTHRPAPLAAMTTGNNDATAAAGRPPTRTAAPTCVAPPTAAAFSVADVGAAGALGSLSELSPLIQRPRGIDAALISLGLGLGTLAQQTKADRASSSSSPANLRHQAGAPSSASSVSRQCLYSGSASSFAGGGAVPHTAAASASSISRHMSASVGTAPRPNNNHNGGNATLSPATASHRSYYGPSKPLIAFSVAAGASTTTTICDGLTASAASASATGAAFPYTATSSSSPQQAHTDTASSFGGSASRSAAVNGNGSVVYHANRGESVSDARAEGEV